MRIGFNAHLLSLTSTYRAAGVSNFILPLLRGLSGIDSRNAYSVFLGRSDRVASLPEALGLGPNFRLRTGSLPTENPLARLLWEQTAQPLRARGLDVLHGPVNVVPVLGAVPRVVTIHDLAFLLFRDRHLPAKRRYLTAMTRLSVRRARKVIAVSENTRQDVIRLLGVPAEKVVTVPNGVGEEFRFLGHSPEGCSRIEAFRREKGLPERFFFYLGTLEPRKNIPLLLRAYAALRASWEGAEGLPKLVIAGAKGWMYGEVFSRVKELAIEEEVLFPGFVPAEEVAWWYNAALAFVYLSAYEGFGLPPLQAMACGLPVVVHNASSLPEVVGDAGLLVEAGDTDAVASALRELAESPERRQCLRDRGLERAARFSWKASATQTLSVYESVVGGAAACCNYGLRLTGRSGLRRTARGKSVAFR